MRPLLFSVLFLCLLALPTGSAKAQAGEDSVRSLGILIHTLASEYEKDPYSARIGELAQDIKDLHTRILEGGGTPVVKPVSAKAVVQKGDPIETSTGVFTVEFDVTANDSDIYIPRNAVRNGTNQTAGVTYGYSGPRGTEAALITSTAEASSLYFRVDEGETERFTVTVTIDPAKNGRIALGLSALYYNTAAAGDVIKVPLPYAKYKTKTVYVPNTERKGAAAALMPLEDGVYAVVDMVRSVFNI